jgi:hypothetical protein
MKSTSVLTTRERDMSASGTHNPPEFKHSGDIAQVWYIIEGEFTFAGKLHGPGTIAYMADPHFEHEMHTATGGTIFFVQYPRSDDRRPADLRRPDESERSAAGRAAGPGALMRVSEQEARQDGEE